MDKTKNQQASPPEVQPAPQASAQSPLTPPCCSSLCYSKTLLIPIILAIIVLLLGVGYLAGAKVLSPQAPFVVSPQITPYPTPTPDLMASWKTYRSDKWNIEFNYPTEFKILKDTSSHLLIAKDQLGTDGISIVSDQDADYIAVSSLKPCSVINEEINRNPADRPSCLDAGKKFGQLTDIDTIELGGNNVKSFYVTSTGMGGIRHILQTINKSFIQLTSADPDETVFNQILSTFKFIDQQYMVSGNLTKGASDQDIEVLKQAVSRYIISFGLLESFPPGFQIITKDQNSCGEVKKILTGYKFVGQFSECKLRVTPTNPNQPVSSE